MANARTTRAIDTLAAGGFFWGETSKDFHGRPIVAITLRDANNQRVKGVGEATLVELVRAGMILHNGENFAPSLQRYRGFILGRYTAVYGPYVAAW